MKGPLSFSQESLWGAVWAEDVGAQYNVLVAMRVRGHVSLDRANAALRQVVDNHDALRLYYPKGPGVTEQHLDDTGAAAAELEQLDLSSEADARVAGISHLEAWASHVFDLRQPPLYKAILIRLSDTESYMGFLFHHLIFDGWSAGLLCAEYFRILEADDANTGASQSDAGSFLTYCREQHGMAAQGHFDAPFWQDYLSEPLLISEIPGDCKLGGVWEPRGFQRGQELRPELLDALTARAQELGVTLFVFMLSAFLILLRRYNDQDRIMVGVPLAGRPDEAAQKLVGCFVNTLPLGGDISLDASADEIVQNLNGNVLEVLARQHTSVATLAREIASLNGVDAQALYSVGFAFDDHRDLVIEQPKLAAEPVAIPGSDVHFPLSVSVTVAADGRLTVEAEASKSVADVATVSLVLRHYLKALEILANRPKVPIAQWPLFTVEEIKQQLEHWNATAQDWPLDERIEQPVSSVSLRYPESIAVSCGTDSLTYELLEARSNQLAHKLRAAGLNPGSAVAVLQPRNEELPVSLLAIWKAGCVLVPLDLELPEARIRFMLEDSGATGVITAPTFGPLVALPTLGWAEGQMDQELASFPTQPPEIARTAQDTAYIMYTSGTTGEPKGVRVSHRAVCNHFLGVQELLAMVSKDKWLATNSIVFDPAILQLIAPLWFGAQVVVATEADVLDGNALLGLIDSKRISILDMTPTGWRLLLEATSRRFPDLQALVGGEALPPSLASELSGRVRRLWNMYGPTEATIACASGLVRVGDKPVTIGQPLANMRAYVLDEKRQLRPYGIPGELYVAGVGLAQGYHEREAMTQSRFVRSPALPGEKRIYRTGDRVYWQSDGRLVYDGRVDTQIKIRGYRVELGEIESVLERHEAVADASATATNNSAGVGLQGFVVLREGKHVEAASLQEYLRIHLPAYMIPQHIEFMQALPLLPSGKLDRKKLAALQATPPANKPITSRRAASVEEKMLLEVWEQVLGRSDLNLDSNFFELGGDSIQAMQVAAGALEFGLRLTTKDVFDHPTVEGLAQSAERMQEVGEQASLEGEVPLLPLQNWFFCLGLKQAAHWNQSVCLEVAGSLDRHRLEVALQALVNYHDGLRAVFPSASASGSAFVKSVGAPVEFEWLELETAGESARDELAQVGQTAQAHLNISRGPLFKALAVWDGQEQGWLILVCHHLLVDTVSWRILIQDLNLLYRALSDERPLVLPPKTCGIDGWVRYLASRAPEQSAPLRDYWERVNDQVSSALLLPEVEGENLEQATVVDHRQLAADATANIVQASLDLNVTMEELLLGAFASAVCESFGLSSIALELESHGRHVADGAPDLARTVGWFTAQYPVVLHDQELNDPERLLEHVKHQVRSVPAHGLDHAPLSANRTTEFARPSINFNYLGHFDGQSKSNEVFSLCDLDIGSDIGDKNQRTNEFELILAQENKSLSMSLGYARTRFGSDSIEALQDLFLVKLSRLVEYSRTVTGVPYVASDFPDAPLLPYQLAELPSGVEDIYGLTPLQEGMLFHSLAEEDRGVYNCQSVLELNGHFDAEALQRALDWLIGRYDVLRTFFVWRRVDRPLQLVLRQAACRVQQHDHRQLRPAAAQEALRSICALDRDTPFRLDQTPLMRVRVVSQSDDRHLLVWTFHHVILDGWSNAIVLDELMESYRLARQSQPLPEDETDSFREYVKWLEIQSISDARLYWRDHLQGLGRVSQLLGEAGDGPDNVLVEASGCKAAEVATFCAQHKVTPNTLFQAAWMLTLCSLDGSTEQCFGVTVAGRPADLPGTQDRVGLFINTLPMRLRPQADMTFARLCRHIQEVLIDHERFAFTPLVDIKASSPLPAGQPLFEVVFVYENYPVHHGEVPDVGQGADLEIGDAQAEDRTNYPWVVTVAPGETFEISLRGENVNADVAAAQMVADRFASIVQFIARNSQSPLAKLEYPGWSSWLKQLASWNNTQTDWGDEVGLDQAIAEHLVSAPTTLALVCDSKRISRQELQQRSSQLATYLRKQYDSSLAPIGICMPRNVDMVVAMLAAVKLGRPYVPIDPKTPLRRINEVVADSGLEVMISSPPLELSLSGCDLLDMHNLELAAELQTQPDTFAGEARLDDVAYIIYTSGSTGKPKGVRVTHRNLMNFLRSMRNRPGLTSEDRLLCVTSLAFDISALEIWLPLMVGAMCVIATAEESMGDELAAAIKQHDITVLQATPSRWKTLVLTGWQGCQGLKALSGGEPLSPDLAQALRDRVGSLWNMYGPTETTIWSTCTRISDHTLPPCVGEPIANTQLAVLDSWRRPCPPGVVGRLFIGGDGVAPGYHNRSALTSERFISPPDWLGVDGPIYDTGDLARWRGDGQVEVLGRTDDQVKIRGYRVELGDLDVAMESLDFVSQAAAVVTARGEQTEPVLVAFVVMAEGVSFETKRLRKALADRLPPYMIPQHYRSLASLPLNVSGKVDRNQLKAMESGASIEVSREALEPPQGQLERRLAGIFCDVLQLDVVGRNENFFELGGHSLTAIRAVSQISSLSDDDLKIGNFFAAPTVADLADRLSGELKLDAGVELAERPPLPSSHVLTATQERLWLAASRAGDDPAFNVVDVIMLGDAITPPQLREAIHAVVCVHDALRMEIQLSEDGLVQIPQPIDEQSLPFELVVTDSDDEADQVVEQFANTPISLDVFPYLAFLAAKRPDGTIVLACRYHHILVDGYSVGLLRKQIIQLCERLPDDAGKGELVPTRFGEFAHWENELGTSARPADESFAYWNAKLSPIPHELQLPLDRQRPEELSYAGASVDVNLTPQDLEQILDFGSEYDATTYMLMMAVLNTLLFRYGNEDKITVMTPVSGRTQESFAHTVGCCMHTLPLISKLAADMTFIDVVDAVKLEVLTALDNQDLSVERLLRNKRTSAIGGLGALYQVLFSFESIADTSADVGDENRLDGGIAMSGAQVELAVFGLETLDSIDLIFEYNSDLFDPSTARRMARHFKRILRRVIIEPNTAISKLAFLDSSEIPLNNNIFAAEPAEVFTYASLPEQVLRACGRFYSNTAIMTAGRQISYAQLASRIQDVRSRLAALDLPADAVVGVLPEDSIDYAVAVVAVSSLGLVFLSLDVAGPEDAIHEDPRALGVTVILGGSDRIDLPGGIAHLAIEANDLLGGYETKSTERLVFPEAHQPAYIVRTADQDSDLETASITHGELANFAHRFARQTNLSAADRCLALGEADGTTSLAELVVPLTVGATVISSEVSPSQGALLEQELRDRNVSWMLASAESYDGLLEAGWSGGPKLKAVCYGAVFDDRLCTDLLDQVAALWTAYGIPGRGTLSFCNQVRVPADCRNLGAPVAEFEAIVLDAQGMPAARGIAGEIALVSLAQDDGFDALADRPDSLLTPAKLAAGLVLMTGDRGVMDSSNRILLRRGANRHVRYSGRFIDLDHIADTLLARSDIVAADVAVVPMGGHGDSLVAYYVCGEGARVSQVEIRKHMVRKLPTASLPLHYFQVAELPEDGLDSVTKMAFPAATGHESTVTAEPATSREEKALADIWMTVLGTDDVSRFDNFFDLGGHSLNALEVIVAYKSATDLEIPIAELATNTLAGVTAACISERA